MSLQTRKPIDDIQERLDALEYVNDQVTEKVTEIPFFKTDTKGKYFVEVNGTEFEVTEKAINQYLGIGKFSVKSFKDARRVNIKGPMNAETFMLNSVKKYADKQSYKLGFYKGHNTHIVNPEHPHIDGIAMFKAIFDKLGELALTPKVYEMDYDPITGRQSLELVVEEWNKETTIELNKTLGVGFKITNSTTGHGYFSVQIFGVQLICTNGMTANVHKAGFKLLHRTYNDLLRKARQFIYRATGDYANIYSIDDEFYKQLAESTVLMAKRHSHLIADALERAQAIKLNVPPIKYFKALQKKNAFITKKDMDRMIFIRESDPTIDSSDNSLLNIIQSMTRYANEVVSPTKREELQEYAYQLAIDPLVV